MSDGTYYGDMSRNANGVAILTIRTLKNISRRALAKQIELSPQYLSRVEHETADATETTLNAIAHAMDIPLNAITCTRQPKEKNDHRNTTKHNPGRTQ